MAWFGRKREDATQALITALLQESVERHKNDQELQLRRQEVELKKMELELQYAESSAKAKVVEAEGRAAIRAQKKAAGVLGGNAKAARAAAPPDCKVCRGDVHLTPFDIGYHHADHSPGFQLPMDWN